MKKRFLVSSLVVILAALMAVMVGCFDEPNQTYVESVTVTPHSGGGKFTLSATYTYRDGMSDPPELVNCRVVTPAPDSNTLSIGSIKPRATGEAGSKTETGTLGITLTPTNGLTPPGTYTAECYTASDPTMVKTTFVLTGEATPAQRPNNAPTAKITTDKTSGNAPLTVNFSGTGSSDSDGTIASYGWTFGDGSTSTAATVAHTYLAAGTYTATLQVTDNQGATATSTVTITTTTAQPGGQLPPEGVTLEGKVTDGPLVTGFPSTQREYFTFNVTKNTFRLQILPNGDGTGSFTGTGTVSINSETVWTYKGQRYDWVEIGEDDFTFVGTWDGANTGHIGAQVTMKFPVRKVVNKQGKTELQPQPTIQGTFEGTWSITTGQLTGRINAEQFQDTLQAQVVATPPGA